jgi:hypothetical protein
MTNEHGTTVKVIEHIILCNYWEYYILDTNGYSNDSDIRFALVVGDYTEMGSVSMDEIAPYIVSRTTNLDNVMPPYLGWTWYDRVLAEPSA